MRYPGYLDNDLSIFKSFPTRESQRFELRVQGQNFINHPNPQFNLDGNNDDIQVDFSTMGVRTPIPRSPANRSIRLASG